VLHQERRRAILDLLSRPSRVLVPELSRHFETSQVTIRKDLVVLHAHGMVHRTRGSALPSRDGALEDPTLREKEKLHRQKKRRIADSAASMVKEGQVIILDSGPTTTAIARPSLLSESDHHHQRRQHHRRTGRNCRRSNSHGRHLPKNSFSLVGPIAEETLRRLSADLLFLGVDGFDVHYGLSTPNLLEAKVNRVMVEVTKRTVAVCDSGKFGHRSLSLIVPTSALQEVITDRGAPKSDLSVLKQGQD
jgi:DeoR family transcriptional regulator, aga operon transcriptional repressor